MEQPLPQCWSTNSVPRAFFPRVAIGCRLSLKRPELVAIFGGGLIRRYMIWYDVNRRYGIWRIFIQICDINQAYRQQRMSAAARELSLLLGNLSSGAWLIPLPPVRYTRSRRSPSYNEHVFRYIFKHTMEKEARMTTTQAHVASISHCSAGCHL